MPRFKEMQGRANRDASQTAKSLSNAGSREFLPAGAASSKYAMYSAPIGQVASCLSLVAGRPKLQFQVVQAKEVEHPLSLGPTI